MIDKELLRSWGLPGFTTEEEAKSADAAMSYLLLGFTGEEQLGIVLLEDSRNNQKVPAICILTAAGNLIPLAILMSNDDARAMHQLEIGQLPGCLN